VILGRTGTDLRLEVEMSRRLRNLLLQPERRLLLCLCPPARQVPQVASQFLPIRDAVEIRAILVRGPRSEAAAPGTVTGTYLLSMGRSGLKIMHLDDPILT
jgi:hypothetical protein